MESSSSWPSSPINRIKAIKELTKGQILTDWLQEMIGQSETIESSRELVDHTLVQIMGMFERTRSVLRPNISFNQTHDHMTSSNSWDDNKLEEESIKNVETMIQKVRRGCYKRRKNPMIYQKVTFNLVDDGYAWRKYGQKAIVNSKHQRQYYRCTHRYELGCKATKQVQMINDKPSKYKISYHQHHSCNNSLRSRQVILDYPNPKEDSVLISFETKTLTGKKQVGFSSSVTRHKPNEGFPSLSFVHDRVSSSDHYNYTSTTTWDPIAQLSQVPLEPVASMMSYGLDDHEDIFSSGVFSSTCGASQYEMGNMLLSDDFGDHFPELCS